jgi:hypothetical protein
MGLPCSATTYRRAAETLCGSQSHRLLFGIYRPLLSQTAPDHAPKLRLQMAGIIAAEFPQ